MRQPWRLGVESLPPALAIALAIYGLSFLLNDAVTWSNPEYLVFSVPGAMDSGPGFTWQDFRKAFDPLTFDIVRPRFLNYWITALNVKFRLALYEYFIPPVNLSLMLVVHLVMSPLLLFLTVRNLLRSNSIALSATCLYLTSVGFLSTSVFFVQPGKILIHSMGLLLVWILSLMQKRDGEKYFAEHAPLLVAFVFVLNFIALSLDDTYAIVAVVACALFWRLFVPRRIETTHLRRAGFSIFAFFVPFLFFIAFVWKIAPEVSAAIGAGHCDYIGFVFDQSATVARTPLWPVFRDLAATAIASTFLVRPYPENMLAVLLRLTNTQTIVVTATLVGIALFAFMQAKQKSSTTGGKANPAVAAFIALGVFFALQAVYQRFHVQITGGYYYASLGAIFVSIFLACVVASLRSATRWVGHAALLVLMAIQLSNFIDLNQRWKKMHMPLIPYSLSTVRGIYENVITDDGLAPTPEQQERMTRIWKEWKNGRREDLTGEANWPGSEAWFLVEMNALSGFVYRDRVRRCGEQNRIP